MALIIGDLALRDPVLLAPMAGVTDAPFRRLVARWGAGLTVSEMVASREIVTGGAEARARAEMDGAVLPAAIQIAGREARWMAEAARIAEGLGAALIDINMGCPAKRVTGGLSGAALMREPGRAARLVEAVVGAVRLPVTVKMRLGWDEASRNAPRIARLAEAAGAAMITVHGRTRAQFYAGAADWGAVRAVRDAVAIPVIVNGDVAGPADARRALALSGAEGVMIGRAARGAPWVLAQTAAALAGRAPPPAPGPAERAEMIAAHYEDMLAFFGRDIGARCARKHLSWHLAGFSGAEGLRARLMRETDPAAVLGALRRELPGLPLAAARGLAA